MSPLHKTPGVLIRTADRMIEKAKNILHSAKILFTEDRFPEHVTPTEKEAFKESLVFLKKGVQKTRSIQEALGKQTPEQEQEIHLLKKQVENDFQQMTEHIAEEKNQKLVPLGAKKQEIQNTIQELTRVYAEKKRVLQEELKNVSRDKKAIEESQKNRLSLAKSARKKANNQIKMQLHPEVHVDVLIDAEKTIENLKTEISRTKASVSLLFPSATESEIVHNILHGEIRASQIPTQQHSKHDILSVHI